MDKIIFFGADAFGLPTFQKLYEDRNTRIISVVTRTPKPAGRGLKPSPNPIINAALSRGISITYTESITDWDVVKKLIVSNNPTYALVVGFGKIIPADVLDLLPNKFINIHPSLLPKYRGPSPIESAIIADEKTTGVSFMILGEKMDAGPLLHQIRSQIDNETLIDLENKLSQIAADHTLKTVHQYLENKIRPTEQIDSHATYTHVITKNDGFINDSNTARQIDNKYRAYIKWPGVYFVADSKSYKIIDGEISDDYFLIKQIQPEGKNIMSGRDFINGYSRVLTKLPKFAKII